MTGDLGVAPFDYSFERTAGPPQLLEKTMTFAAIIFFVTGVVGLICDGLDDEEPSLFHVGAVVIGAILFVSSFGE